MKYNLIAEISAQVEISDSDFELILQTMANHYDYTVLRSVECGGFLYGLNNRRSFSKGKDKVCDFTQRQMGLILKGFEMNNSDQASIISGRLHSILWDLVKKGDSINKELLEDVKDASK